jgi:enoyl-CoA hydratase/carnithine racemase
LLTKKEIEMANYENRWQSVKIDVEEGIAWVTLNRPDKRNAMSPLLNREMIDVLETDGKSDVFQERMRRDRSQWQWKLLRFYNKATIAMVNSRCFGGAFSPATCPKSTGASRRATWSASPSPTPWVTARRCIT